MKHSLQFASKTHWCGISNIQFCTALLSTVVLGKISSAEATLFLTTEPMWASLFGWITLGELMGPTALVGGSLIIAACYARLSQSSDLNISEAIKPCEPPSPPKTPLESLVSTIFTLEEQLQSQASSWLPSPPDDLPDSLNSRPDSLVLDTTNKSHHETALPLNHAQAHTQHTPSTQTSSTTHTISPFPLPLPSSFPPPISTDMVDDVGAETVGDYALDNGGVHNS
jgi:hypothetical protein